jgi:amino acid transporter
MSSVSIHIAFQITLQQCNSVDSSVAAVAKGTNIALIILVLLTAFPHGDIRNWDNFLPFGQRGIFAGAATIYFAYGGYNAAANLAEEVRQLFDFDRTRIELHCLDIHRMK